ncbi:MAG: radical SAM protein [Oscillospiraceae bacterium]|nr:radical SAM protein [Oscillospiraceae bacterium]
MKPSVFNFAYERKDGSCAVFNTFSRAVVVFDSMEQYRETFRQACTAPAPGETVCGEAAALQENGLLVADELDELDVLKYFHYKAKFSNESLILTIAPTMQCNFACPYCYEKARTGHMSTEIQDALVDYVCEKLEQGARDVDLTWYGGEPLLYPDVIDRVTGRIAGAVRTANAKLGCTMVTNGSLLTPDIVAMLQRNEINSIQITLDGMAENHNARRPFRNGGGSFDRIVSNLSLFAGTGIRVNVRMNVDRKNKGDYAALREVVDGLRPQVEISLYPALVEHLNADDLRSDVYLSGSEYEAFLRDCRGAEHLDADEMALANNRRYFCTAELDNCFVVDELGNFYKCWDEIGRPELVCFNLLDRERVNYSAIVRYVADDPFREDSRCRNCCFLPLCFGGCRYQKYYFGGVKCSFTPESVSAFVESKYLT